MKTCETLQVIDRVTLTVYIGAGVQCVIAKSFAFIFQRNMPNLGLLGITMEDDHFFDIATDGKKISIHLDEKEIEVDGQRFGFQLSQMEKELFDHGGIASAFQHFGNRLFEVMTAKRPTSSLLGGSGPFDTKLQW